MAAVFQSIFKRPKYLILLVLSSVVAYLLLVVVSNINLFQNTLFRGDFTLDVKAAVFTTAIANSLLVSGSTTILLAVLLGFNIAAITFYFRNKISKFRAHSSATSIVGIIAGIFGLGCAACGSFIITSLIPFFGLGTLFTILPFHGVEFGFIGILLLCISLFLTLREIQNPAVCNIE